MFEKITDFKKLNFGTKPYDKKHLGNISQKQIKI